MSRWVTSLVCAIIGLALLGLGLIIPAHLRAVDATVIERAGDRTTGLSAPGLQLAAENQLGAAQLITQAPRQEDLPGREKLEFAVDELARQHPSWVVWGGPQPQFESIFQKEGG